MAQPLIADLPRDILLTGDYIIRVTALNAATGATVSGVNVSNVAITVLDVATGQVTSGSPDAGDLEQIFEMPNAPT